MLDLLTPSEGTVKIKTAIGIFNTNAVHPRPLHLVKGDFKRWKIASICAQEVSIAVAARAT